MDSLGPQLVHSAAQVGVRQDENFLTESLAVVVEQLLLLAPDVGTRLISRLTGGFVDVSADDARLLQLSTQVEAVQGRPDLEIRAPHRLVWIEVKAEAPLRTGQLAGYRHLLGDSGIDQTKLVLLTRHPETYVPEDARPDLEVRWFELADWLDAEQSAIETAGTVATFLADQFLGFLRTRGMTLAQVSKYMPDGLRALKNLLTMLNEAAMACKVQAISAAAWESHGLYLDRSKYWLGITYDEPEKLWFGTRCRIDSDKASRLGVGELGEESWIPGRFRWWCSAELDSEEIHFFSRSKVSQIEWLEGFLRDCLEKAHSIETPDQPPIPEEPEGE